MGPKSNKSVLIRDRHTETHREKKSTWKRRQRLEGCSYQPRETCSHQKLEEARKRSPSTTFRSSMAPADALTLDFRPPELWKNKFLLYSIVLYCVCLSSPGHEHTYFPLRSPPWLLEFSFYTPPSPMTFPLCPSLNSNWGNWLQRGSKGGLATYWLCDMGYILHQTRGSPDFLPEN